MFFPIVHDAQRLTGAHPSLKTTQVEKRAAYRLNIISQFVQFFQHETPLQTKQKSNTEQDKKY